MQELWYGDQGEFFFCCQLPWISCLTKFPDLCQEGLTGNEDFVFATCNLLPSKTLFAFDDSILFLEKLLEEMKRHSVKLKGETYICLLNALAATGRTDQVYVYSWYILTY